MPLLDAINNKVSSAFNPAKPGNVPSKKSDPSKNWRALLRPASFRKARFSVVSTSSEGGRRTVLHQFPFDDVPYWEDMGKEANTYQIQAFIVANSKNQFNYFTEKKILIDALEETGAGTLIHPFFLKPMSVGIQGKYKVDESFSEGGVARFTITFVDAGRARTAVEIIKKQNINTVADGVHKANLDWYDKLLKGFKKIQEQAAFIKSALDGATTLANDIYSGINSIQTTVVGVVSAGQTFVASIRGTYSSLMKFPSQFKGAITNTFSTYQSFGAHMKKGNTSHVSAALRLASMLPAAVPATTTPVKIAVNKGTLLLHNTQLAGNLAEAVRAAADVEYTSYDQTKGMLDDINSTMDTVLGYIGTNFPDDNLSTAIEAMRPVITSILLDKGASLPTTRYINIPPDVTPALVIAQQLYGDSARDVDIISMNGTKMRHPGFAPSGDVIQVLSA